jgi:hypothetical protein
LYRFTLVPVGTYNVCEILDGNHAGWTSVNPFCQEVMVSEGQTATADFFNYEMPVTPTGTIEVCKYEDKDGNGEPDQPLISFLEKVKRLFIKVAYATTLYTNPLAGWTINITDGDGYSDSKVTGDNGCVQFTDLPYTAYTITETMQSGWVRTMPEANSIVINLDASYNWTYFLNHQEAGMCTSQNILLDEVPQGSLSGWTVTDTGNNPIFSYSEITSPYDDSTALQTSVVGDTYQYCPSQYISKTYTVSGNTDATDLKAYLAFTSTMDYYNFPYVEIILYDSQDAQVGYQVYYGNGVISGIYAGYAAADPVHYTELSAASGYMTLDLAKIGSNLDFSKVRVILSNYACVGQNSVTFDHLRLVTQCGDEPVDVCTNIDGVQTEVPSGYTESGGICTETSGGGGTELTDMCSNIEGVQTEVPQGMTAVEGICTETSGGGTEQSISTSGGGGGGGGSSYQLIISNERMEASSDDTSVTITWDTNHQASSRVVYDTTSHPYIGSPDMYGYAFTTTEDSTLVSHHTVVISGLTPGTNYYFRPVSHGSPETTGIELAKATTGGGSGTPSVLGVTDSGATPKVLGATDEALPRTGGMPEALFITWLAPLFKRRKK